MEKVSGRATTVPSSCNSSIMLEKERDAVQTVFHRDIEVILPRLRRYARSLTRDAVDADDLVQESVARALAKFHLWEVGTDLRAWLFTILHNQYVSEVRRAVREGAAIEWSEDTATSTCAPRQIAHLEVRDVKRALMSLPEQQRTVVLLIGVTRTNYYEAAAACDVPVGTIRSRLARGRRALRELTGLAPLPRRIAAGRKTSTRTCAGTKLPNLAGDAPVTMGLQ